MTQTEKLGLVLPDENESYNISVFNDNFRTIDENIGGAENLENLLTEDKTSLVNAINEVFQSGGDVKASIVNAILTADSTISITTDNTWGEICAAIIMIDTNWEATDKANRALIAQACNTAETTNVATLGMYAPWTNIKTFILDYLTNG